jgi:Trk K+ transport system NAD-binding subunit
MPYSQLVLTQKKQLRSRSRLLRAIWQDTQALLSEFRSSIYLFVLVTTCGGFLYGELYRFARGVTIPLHDRPYLILQLMILETPESVPSEWYLVVFWYLLPIVFIFIVGRGAADFIRLFFNRDGRRDAWRRALASTYRNHVIVFGAGHVGMRVIHVLAEMGVDVVVIDNSPDPGVEEALTRMHIPLIEADGRLPTTLQDASLRHADAFIACTRSDHTNLETIMRVRDLNPDIRIVARMWDGQFSKQLGNFMNVQTVLSSSDLAAPAFAGAALGLDITQTLKVGEVDYSVLCVTVEPNSFMDNATIGLLQEKNNMDIVLHSRGDSVSVQPSRDLVVCADDTLVIFARHDNIINIAARNRRNAKQLPT